MKILKQYLFIALALFLTNITFCAQNAKRPWTFLVYMAADNNLNPDADSNIAQMVKASNTANVYILVYLNIKRSGQAKMTQKLIIQNGKVTQEGATTVEDSGDANTLIKAMTWAVTEFPSDHLLVDLWNHGSGSLNRRMLERRGVCYDDSTGHYMTDLDYKRAFDVIVNQYRSGTKIDIIAFDACLMADLEVAFTLQTYANYMVASQQTVPGPGYNYTDVLSLLAKNVPDASTLAQGMVTSYNNYYKTSGESYTLAAINLNKLAPATAATNAIAQLLNSLLANDTNGTLSNVLTTSADPSICPHFDEPTYLDLYTFYANLYMRTQQAGLNTATATQLKNALRTGMTTINQAVIANAHSSEFAKVHGLSIYFADPSSGIEPSYASLYWTTANPAWDTFLNSYVNSVGY